MMQDYNKQFENACRLIVGNERERVSIGTWAKKRSMLF